MSCRLQLASAARITALLVYIFGAVNMNHVVKMYAPYWRYDCLSDNKLLNFWGCARKASFSSTLSHSMSPNAVPLNSTKDFYPPDSMT